MFEKVLVVTPDGHVHEYYEKPEKRPITNTRRAIAIAALVGAVTGGAAAIGLNDAFKASGVANMEIIAQKAALREAIISQNAHDQAQALTDLIGQITDNGTLIGRANILDGTIYKIDASNDSNHIPLYKDAYLLSDIGAFQYDHAGNFLQSAWIGIASNDSVGRMVIKPVLVDADTMRFETNHTATNPVIDISIRVQSVNYVPGGVQYKVVPYDSTGNNMLYNANGSIIQPGLNVSSN